MSSSAAQTNKQICVFLLDNFDSFTYNLVDELRTLGLELIVYRNSVSADLVLQKMQDKAQQTDENGQSKQVMLMLSPGPGNPSQAGSMLALLDLVKGQFPVLGICLGHQAIVESYGGKIVRADKVMHGKSSLIEHCADKMFTNMPQPLPVARYHSLMASNMPDELTVLANFSEIPMAVAHLQDKMLGFQFHPESILTSHGSQLLMQSIEFLTQDKGQAL
ncbi:aminodeoxychorismate/anthranilate synthase component II [uncultured Paraglaciecola sp.]|jgi:anthranilate synthase component II|uniref:aminodeoxychorismate/anthranilate synthase component II n=1 Tax=uncultured Paraglaciecola sp. TaxID=1765024 RepID=UPI0025E8A27F|nr:aminodeoxychorismate/anthranilate synthase component II [uncultured Paraglaciecola sp.]